MDYFSATNVPICGPSENIGSYIGNKMICYNRIKLDFVTQLQLTWYDICLIKKVPINLISFVTG